jgi:hypothetical protein
VGDGGAGCWAVVGEGIDVSSGEWPTAREASRACDTAMIVLGLALPAAQLIK